MSQFYLMDLLIFAGSIASIAILHFAYPQAFEWRGDNNPQGSPENCPLCQSSIQPNTTKCPQCKEWIDPSIRLRSSGIALLSTSTVSILFLWDLHIRISQVFKQLYMNVCGEFPLLHQVAFSIWYTIPITVFLMGFNIVAVSYPKKLSTKNKLLGISCALGILAIFVQFIGFYLPMFSLAGNVKAD